MLPIVLRYLNLCPTLCWLWAQSCNPDQDVWGSEEDSQSGDGDMQSVHHEVNSRGDFVYMGKESLAQERVGREGSVQGCV